MLMMPVVKQMFSLLFNMILIMVMVQMAMITISTFIKMMVTINLMKIGKKMLTVILTMFITAIRMMIMSSSFVIVGKR